MSVQHNPEFPKHPHLGAESYRLKFKNEFAKHQATIKALKTAKQDMKVLWSFLLAALIGAFVFLFLYVFKAQEYKNILYTAHTLRHNMGVIAKNQEFIHGKSDVADMINRHLPALPKEE